MQPVAKLRHSRTQRALSHPGSGVNFPQPGNRVHVVLGSILLDNYNVIENRLHACPNLLAIKMELSNSVPSSSRLIKHRTPG
ncbi:hypothetical protein V2G26_008215 [Clonostachys chloroleuca]